MRRERRLVALAPAISANGPTTQQQHEQRDAADAHDRPQPGEVEPHGVVGAVVGAVVLLNRVGRDDILDGVGTHLGDVLGVALLGDLQARRLCVLRGDVDGYPLPGGGLHLGPGGQILRAAHAGVARAQLGVRRAEPRADHDARGEAELARDERDGGRELLIVADGGDVVLRRRRPRVGLALEQATEHRVDAGEGVTGRARLERVVRQRPHPQRRLVGDIESVAEVAPIAQEHHQPGQGGAVGTRRVLVDPGAQTVGRCGPVAEATRRLDRREVRFRRLDRRKAIGIAGVQAAAPRSARPPPRPRGSRTDRRARPRGPPRSRPIPAARRSASRSRRAARSRPRRRPGVRCRHPAPRARGRSGPDRVRPHRRCGRSRRRSCRAWPAGRARGGRRVRSP